MEKVNYAIDDDNNFNSKKLFLSLLEIKSKENNIMEGSKMMVFKSHPFLDK